MTLLRQPSHWIVLVIVLVIVFGASRLPSIAKNVGQSFKIFKKEMQSLKDDGKEITQATDLNAGDPVSHQQKPAAQGETDPTKLS